MLGGGNPVGSNPAGIGSVLNYVGKHVYANSGAFEAKTTDQTMFSFTSAPNSYIVGKLIMTAPIRFADIANGQNRGYHLSFNNELVGTYKVDSSQEDMPSSVEVSILIPPNTLVTLVCRDGSDASTYDATASLVGEVYA